MEPMNAPDIDAAAAYIAANARVVDRRRFERLFGGGDARPVRDAVAAYRNDDGGFGHALEPECRAPGSQSRPIEMALRIMDETDAWDEAAGPRRVRLAGVGRTRRGRRGLRRSRRGRLAARALVGAEEGHPASVIATGLIAGTLHARGVSHPWLDRATELMWARLADLADARAPYDMLAVFRFLQRVPDRDRAREVFGRVGPLILDRKLVTLDPEAPGEVHFPLDFAPEPDSLARELFDEATIKAHLDHLARAQRDDGGWMFNWLAWSPAAEREWRGFLTVDALRILRANGYLA